MIASNIESALNQSIAWLLYSNIQNKKNKPDLNGGFNAWYDLKNQEYSYVYSEITGYGITALLYLNSVRKNPELISSAKQAADWLIENALLDCGGVLTRKYLQKDLDNPNYSFGSGIIYAFDTGMVLFGIANLYKIAGERKYLDAAKKMGECLLMMQRKGSTLEPIYNSRENTFKNTDEKWSTQSGSFHAKVAMGLIALYEITREKKYKSSAIMICDKSLEFQQPDGRFISFKDTGATHMHPHCYSCEGLYYVGKKLNNSTYVAAALKGTIWSLKSQLLDGGVPSVYHPGSGYDVTQRTDTLAQVLRIAVYFLNDNFDILKEYKSNIYNLVSKLLSFQKTDEIQMGGFYYGCNEEGKKVKHINSWCSMFAIQALSGLARHMNQEKNSSEYLV